MFVNGIINFGYWKRASYPTISQEERFESEKELYREVAKILNITCEDAVLEIGCGLGIGAALIMKEFTPMKIKGIDISRERIEKAKEIHKELMDLKLLNFYLENAEKLICRNQSFDKAFSIEAIQHFKSSPNFIYEAFRVLKPNGRLLIASIFTSSKKASEKAEVLLPFKVGIIHWIPINELCSSIQSAGFKNVQVKSIGKNVWEPIGQWISQNNLLPPWNEWYNGYKKCLYDYYIVWADKN